MICPRCRGRMFLDLYGDWCCVCCGAVYVSEADMAMAHKLDTPEGRRTGEHRGDVPVGEKMLATNRASEMRYRQRRKEVKRAHGRGKWM